MSSLVSIITPAYCAGSYIDATIRSVVAQTHAEWELIVADDCSLDDTRLVVADWAVRDRRISLVTLATNGGPAAARNAALAGARGRWVAFLDSDDLWHPEKLAHSIAFAEATHAPLVYTGFHQITADGGDAGAYRDVPDALDYGQLLCNTAIATSTVLIDRTQHPTIRMAPVRLDDFACWLSVLKNGSVARGLNEDLMHYRVLPTSHSRNKLRSARSVWHTYRRVERLSFPRAVWCFLHYAARAALKHRRL